MGAKTFSPVTNHLTLCVSTTCCGTVAGIFAAVQDTSFIITAVLVFPAADDAIPVQANLFFEAVFVLQAALDAVAFHAELTSSTLVSGGTGRPATPFLADHWRRASSVIIAEGWNAHASLKVVVRLSRETMWAETVWSMVLHPTNGVGTTGVGKAAGTLAHGGAVVVGQARRSWGTVRVSVGTFIWMTTSWRAVGVPDVLLGGTLAGGASKLVAADGGAVAGVLLDAVVDELAAAHGIPLVAVSAAADGRVVLGFADGIGPAAPTHYAGINTFMLVADSVGTTVFVLEAVSFDAAHPLVQRIANVTFKTLTNSAVLVRNAHGVSPTKNVLAGISTTVITSVAGFANLVFGTLRVCEASVEWFTVSSDTAELVRTVAV